ncbi:hypothetical protein GZ77_06105 [Endozoicomonas montiporae]|uniref:Uncharacterized protein n=2 Tax=Endozoicomonas montiporae TaxID=1027273 RepID=A0A081NC63_9GAMM|nr:hypothetical protein [Endozoicomonas montiporae]AMO56366.1 WD repeat-containing protein [Endozoicomonas montiporae CL-33]KEQ16036.1 hypothetical protein GZ77_06105 [Endozoicomonas montiporae]
MSIIEKSWAIAGLVISLAASCLQAQAQTTPNAQQPTETAIRFLLEHVIPVDPNRLPETVTSTPAPAGSSVLIQSIPTLNGSSVLIQSIPTLNGSSVLIQSTSTPTPTPTPTTGSIPTKRYDCDPDVLPVTMSISWGRKYRENILAVAISSGGFIGCKSSNFGVVQIFTLGGRREPKLEHTEHVSQWIYGVDFNNGQLAFGGHNKQISVLDDSSFAHLKTLNTTMNIESVVYNHEGTLLAAGTDDSDKNEVIVYNVTDSYSILHRLRNNRRGSVGVLEFNKDSTELAFAEDGNEVWIYDATTTAFLQKLDAESATVNDLDYSDDGNYLAVVGGDQILRVYYKMESDPSFFTLTHALLVGHKLASVVFSPGSTWLVVGLSDGSVRFYDPEDLTIPPQIISHKQAVEGRLYDLQFSDSGTMLAVARNDGISIYRIVRKNTTDVYNDLASTTPEVYDYWTSTTPEVHDYSTSTTPKVHNDSTSTTPLVALFMAVLGGGMLLP